MLLRVFGVATLLLVGGCSDRTESLGSGYFLREEGGAIRDILSERAGGREVPATVTAVAYDDDFILAQQRPKSPPDPLYEAEYVYPDPDRDYFWIINKRDDSISGPLSLQEFEDARASLGVSEDLVLAR